MEKVKTQSVTKTKRKTNKVIVVTKTVEHNGKTLFPKKLKMVNDILSNTVFMK